jgi:RNA polymerase sigma-32 factor
MTHSQPIGDLSHYLREARRTPLLGREQELDLALRWRRQGDRRAAEMLIHAHLRDVIAIARSYRRYGVPQAELIAEGNFGMVQALHKFDPERGLRFMTYAAYWVRSCVIDYVIRTWSIVGGGSSKTFFRLRRERRQVSGLLAEGDEADSLIAKRIGVSAKRVASMMQRIDARNVSLDIRSSDSTSRPLELLLAPDDQEQELSDREAQHGVAEAVLRAVSGLDQRERFIAECRLMADPAEELSLADIGRHFGVSRERARQLEARTKRKLGASIAAFGNAIVRERLPRARPSNAVGAPAA